MEYINMITRKYGIKVSGLTIFIVGTFCGMIISLVFKRFYWNHIDLINVNYLAYIQAMDIDYKKLLNYVLWSAFRNFILIWGVCFTKLGIGLTIFLLLYYGIRVGFFISVLFIEYGLKGFFLLFAYTFPQIIIYIPVLILSFQGGYWLCKNLYFVGVQQKSQLQIIAKYSIFILILAFFLFLGGLLETYIGSFILIRIINSFII